MYKSARHYISAEMQMREFNKVESVDQTTIDRKAINKMSR